MQETDVAGGPGQRGQVASDPPLAPSAVTPPPWKLSSPDSEPALRTPQHRRIPCFLFNSPPPPGPSPGSRLPPTQLQGHASQDTFSEVLQLFTVDRFKTEPFHK